MKPTQYRRILSAFYSSAWAILPSKLVEIQLFLHAAAAGDKPSKEEVAALVGRRPQSTQPVGKVGVIQIFGTISQRVGLLEGSGGTSCEMINAGLDAMLADKTCKTIVLQIDSPGGSVFGVEETARRLFDARSEKKIVAIADGLAASAAYWLGSQADEFCCIPTAQVGSIGCLSAHQDLSEAMKLAGVKTTIFSAGKYKAEDNPFGPLSDEAREARQRTVDEYYSMFVKAVARGRGVSEATVRNTYGQGRCLTADDAKGAGLVDRICSWEQCLSRLGASAGTTAEAFAPSIEARRRRLDLEQAE